MNEAPNEATASDDDIASDDAAADDIASDETPEIPNEESTLEVPSRDRARSLVDSVIVGQPTTDDQALDAARVYAILALAEAVERLATDSKSS